MRALVVAVALLAACRGGKAPSRKDAGPSGSASSVSAPTRSSVPKLPLSEDGAGELRRIDKVLATTTQPLEAITLRLERAAILGRLDDYQQALADSAALVEKTPRDERAWRLRVEALTRVHEFTAAREAMKQLGQVVHPSHLVEYEIALADATGDTERALAGREQLVKQRASAERLTLWAASLAQAGRTDEAIALIPKAAAAVRDNPPQLIAWLLFQWGRCHELAGQHALAREFFAAALARMPGHVEATTHLAQALLATGDAVAAKQLVTAALAEAKAPEHRHPDLLALAAELGQPQLADEARAAWERYVAALPLAFADHAARFYMKRDPARALVLATQNLANRPTRDARALVVEAALAAGDAAGACAVVDPLVSGGTRAQRFVAWQALSRCGRTSDAERLGRDLGIVR